MKIGLQNSRNQRGSKATSARYATAWLNHGVNPTDKGYEYTILVNRPSGEVRVGILEFIKRFLQACAFKKLALRCVACVHLAISIDSLQTGDKNTKVISYTVDRYFAMTPNS